MPEIIKVYRESIPALRLIGKRYTNADRDEFGGYGAKWQEFFADGCFTPLEALGESQDTDNGYLGFMRCNPADFDATFEYWIGMFFPIGTAAPEGYEFADIGAGEAGVCWIKGKEDDGAIYGMHDKCVEKLRENGIEGFKTDAEGRMTFFERYNCPRFTQKDEDGDVILDYAIYIGGETT